MQRQGKPGEVLDEGSRGGVDLAGGATRVWLRGTLSAEGLHSSNFRNSHGRNFRLSFWWGFEFCIPVTAAVLNGSGENIVGPAAVTGDSAAVAVVVAYAAVFFVDLVAVLDDLVNENGGGWCRAMAW